MTQICKHIARISYIKEKKIKIGYIKKKKKKRSNPLNKREKSNTGKDFVIRYHMYGKSYMQVFILITKDHIMRVKKNIHMYSYN